MLQNTVKVPFPSPQPKGALTISIISVNFLVMISASFPCLSLPLNFFFHNRMSITVFSIKEVEELHDSVYFKKTQSVYLNER